jgi:DNA-binding transcriptional LysR family regulator
MDHWILPDLIVFLEVVRAGSLTRAAERLHTVQSNVTARMQQLERATGTTLFKRQARGIRLTPAGEAALALALRADTVMNDLRQTFGRNGRTAPVRIRLGSIETVAATHLPPLVARFTRDHPGAEVTVETGSTVSLLKQLAAGELDAAFVSRRPSLAGFRELPAFSDELTVVAPASLRAVSDLVAPGAAAVKVLVQRLGCSYTERLLAFLNEKARRPHQIRQLGTLEGVLAFVEVGAGIAAMPLAFARAAAGRRKLNFIPLPRKFSRVQTFLIAPENRDASFAVNAFVALCSPPGPPGRSR